MPRSILRVLLYSESKFFQYVEGESKSLTTLYDKIKQDPRHEKAVMISYSPIPARIFPSWQMGSRKIDSDDVSFLTDISATDKGVFKNIMNGIETEGAKVQEILTKFFKK